MFCEYPDHRPLNCGAIPLPIPSSPSVPGSVFPTHMRLHARLFSGFAQIAISAAGEQDLEGRFSP
jgi:hypothetical protein